jgi:squalene synthase HpnC
MSVGHYENFPVASWLLPPPLRQAAATIYWFARSADDFADEGDALQPERLARLDAYRSELRRIEAGASSESPLFSKLARVVREHALPLTPFHDLLDAFSQDVVKKRYRDFEELADYCRRSANPVGRLMLHLFGVATPQHLRWSDAICTSLQLINFWQDVEPDWRKGRVYLPQDDLARFGVSEAQIADARVDDSWRALMTFEVARTRSMLASGAPLARALPGRIGWELRLTVQGGSRILERIDRVGGDVFRHRPVLHAPDWLVMLGRAAFQ